MEGLSPICSSKDLGKLDPMEDLLAAYAKTKIGKPTCLLKPVSYASMENLPLLHISPRPLQTGLHEVPVSNVHLQVFP
jgi:hypothetical protein